MDWGDKAFLFLYCKGGENMKMKLIFSHNSDNFGRRVIHSHIFYLNFFFRRWTSVNFSIPK
jgi:hypothetical protein